MLDDDTVGETVLWVAAVWLRFLFEGAVLLGAGTMLAWALFHLVWFLAP